MVVVFLLNEVAHSCTYSEMSKVNNGTVWVARSMELGGGFLSGLWKMRTHPLGKGFGASNFGFVSIDVALDFPIAHSSRNLSISAATDGMNSEGCKSLVAPWE